MPSTDVSTESAGSPESTGSSESTGSPESAGSSESAAGRGRLRAVLGTSLVPFFIGLFPAVHYLGRNLSTETLYPYVSPTPTTYAVWGLAALAVALVVGVACGLFLHRIVVKPSAADRGVTAHPDDSLLWRTLLPDDRTIRVFLAFVAVIGVWAVTNLGGVGPELFATLLSFVVLPFGLPLLLLAPMAIASHVGVVVGYGACALWTALLARLFVERVADDHGGMGTRSDRPTDGG